MSAKPTNNPANLTNPTDSAHSTNSSTTAQQTGRVGQRPKKKTAAKAKPAVSIHKKPVDMSEADWQREIRKQSVPEAKEAAFIIKFLGGEHPVFGDYSVENPTSGGRYKVALRTAQPGSPNFCSCPDFKTNLLGTCKHIEAVLAFVGKNKKLSKLLKEEYRPAYSSMYLKYGREREVMLRIGENQQEKYQQLAKNYFAKNDLDDTLTLLPGAYDHIDRLLAEATKISPDFRCYPDVLDFIIAQRESRARHALIERTVDDAYLDGLIKATLYPYQKEGILFAARAGRCLIADDMGLGKTIQAIGSAEFFRKACGISSVLIICPTSLKYQWKTEIEKFTDSSVLVIEGDPPKRKLQYQRSDAFYKIISYHVAQSDLDEIRKLSPDLVILDEAQRIKNWQTKTAQGIKKIESTYAIVLTGTPIENKLEELYSIIQFIDPFRLGPLYHFLSEHQIQDESGKVVGYRDLNQIQKLLEDIVIRRTKKSVLSQLPSRTDKHLFVPLTEMQSDIHEEYGEKVKRLVHKWKKFGYLDEKDRNRLMLAMSCMRMVADSTFILDQETRHDTKIDELMYILDDALAARSDDVANTNPATQETHGDKKTDEVVKTGASGGASQAAETGGAGQTNDAGNTDIDLPIKIVVFSQWERMTRLVRAELDARQVGYAYLHGGVPSHKRAGLLDDFRDDPDCRVFLSTDAGGVGLNLQSASLMVNLDIPWNPAVLEQRIGRIHRHGQKRAVNIINLVSSQSIEEKMLDVLAFKASLFAGVLDNGSDQIFMGESKFKKFMQTVEGVTGAGSESQPQSQAGDQSESEATTASIQTTTPDQATATATAQAEAAAQTETPKTTPATASNQEQRQQELSSANQVYQPETTAQPNAANNAGAASGDHSSGTQKDQQSESDAARPIDPTSSTEPAAQFFTAASDFFGSLTKTLSDPVATEKLVTSLIEKNTEKDQTTGQTYFKIPIQNEQLVKGALDALTGLLSTLKR